MLYTYQLISVLQVQPHFASQLGGDELTLLGTNFMPPYERDLLYCRHLRAGATMGVWPRIRARPQAHGRSARCRPLKTNKTNETDTILRATTTLVFLRAEVLLSCHYAVQCGGTKVTIRGGDFPGG